MAAAPDTVSVTLRLPLNNTLAYFLVVLAQLLTVPLVVTECGAQILAEDQHTTLKPPPPF
jgi:hypothetical protein